MILVMGVSLFTSRIVLQELGVSDYGIYSLVGGIVALVGFFNAAMSSATQRYLSFDIGKVDQEKLRKTFSATLTIHAGIALLVLILAETIGLWYVNYKMVFPSERSLAVNVVYQFSIFSFLLGIIQVPYNALIIARERMNVYAYVSILEVVLKLIIVFLLVYFGSDKLITYAILTFVVSFIIRVVYQVYCRKHFKESKYKFEYDREYYRELMSYSGWNLFGNFAVVVKGQGSNLLLNLFFGTTVNAAYGIMVTVNSAVTNFVSNFQIASNPQIIKLYASDNHDTMEKLMNQTIKFSFFLCIIFVAPIFLNIEYILNIWLVNPPKFSAEFVRVILLCTLIDVLSRPIMTGITATGKIKKYHIVIGLLNLLILPVSYCLFRYKIFDSPVIILKIWLLFSGVSLVFRVGFLRTLMNYNLRIFFFKVLVPTSLITVLCVLLGFILKELYPVNNLRALIFQSFLFIVLLIVGIYFLALEKNEKNLLKQLKNNMLIKLKIK